MPTYELPTKLVAGKYYKPVTARIAGDRIVLKFGYHEGLKDDIKAMAGARWEKDDKAWSVLNNHHNRFQLDYLAGRNPYRRFDSIPTVEHRRFKADGSPLLMKHQLDLVAHGLACKTVIWVSEMGTGKTLAAFEVIERSDVDSWLWVAPRSALTSVMLEKKKWGIKRHIDFYTYDGLRNLVLNWPSGIKSPRGIIFDESSRLKSPTAQRSLAALHLANSMRDEHGEDCYIILMSGSPAPKSPADWFMQCEIACPGFLREGTVEKFKQRIAIIVQKEGITGGVYPHLAAWLDDEKKCKHCGEFADAPHHITGSGNDAEAFSATMDDDSFHAWEPSTNEVARLYKRMRGLVTVKFKKDCLDLPEKRYRVLRAKPTDAVLSAAKLIVAGASTTIEGLTRLRELSDGFQYREEQQGFETCPLCRGIKRVIRPMPVDESPCKVCGKPEDDSAHVDEDTATGGHAYECQYEDCEIGCPTCGEKGFVPKYARTTERVACPKDNLLSEILDAHEEDGRLVVYGGFSATIDRICSVFEKNKWNWIRVDGRGWHSSLPFESSEAMLEAFQDPKRNFEYLGFVGHPGSAGMGLTLTAACEEVYFSNDFNAESRVQSEDRIHRAGMDTNRGALITDLVHLETDQLVLENLKRKRDLQSMTLGETRNALDTVRVDEDREV